MKLQRKSVQRRPCWTGWPEPMSASSSKGGTWTPTHTGQRQENLQAEMGAERLQARDRRGRCRPRPGAGQGPGAAAARAVRSRMSVDEATGRRSSRRHLCAPWAKPEGRSLSGGDTCLSSLQLPAATRALPRPTENSSQRTREPLAPQRGLIVTVCMVWTYGIVIFCDHSRHTSLCKQTQLPSGAGSPSS